MSLNKVIIYILTVMLYLGLSKSFSPSEFGINYIINNDSLSRVIQGAPATVILTDMHSTGFLIKTYYQKYKVVYGFQSVEEIIVRTSSKFAKKHAKHIGMSIFRRNSDEENEDFTPLPPGMIFVGDRSLGQWKNTNSGDKVWRFYRPYRNIPLYLGWGDFRPSKDFYALAKSHMTSGKPFFGDYNSFGINGNITKKNFPKYFSRQKPKDLNFKKNFLHYFHKDFHSKK